MDDVMKWVSLISNICTIFASGIAVLIFIFKRKKISSVFNSLINYNYQLSLSEVREKIERLNEYNANSPEQLDDIVNILNEIIGQIKGNQKLSDHFAILLVEMVSLASDKRRLKEPKKRVIVSELRERLRNLNVECVDNLVGDSK